MGSPLIWFGRAAKFLVDKITFESGPSIQAGNLNPTVTAVDGESGDQYNSSLTSAIYVKQDSGSTTNWAMLDDASNEIPSGGTTGQFLEKQSNSNYDVDWANPAFIGLAGYPSIHIGTAAQIIATDGSSSATVSLDATTGALFIDITDNVDAANINMSPTSIDLVATSVLINGASFQDALALKADLESPEFTGTVQGISAAMVGLGSVDNTSDASKPVSTDQQTALNLKANLASPTFTGTVVLPSGQALIAPALGTPASGVATNLTGTATGLTAGNALVVERITCVVNGQGAAIAAGDLHEITIPYACTINSVTLLSSLTGSIVLDIRKCTYAGFPGSLASICAAAKPTLSSADKSEDVTLTGWTVAIAAGDVIRFVVDSASTVQRVTMSLKVTRT